MSQPLRITTRASDRLKRKQLRRMKSFATGLLVVAAITYIFAKRAESAGAPEWVSYVRAAAEAGMIGGLADWFAVTALFRRPLGLPIPHTAIIPTRKDAIGASLGEFVGDNFLSEEVVRNKISSAHIASRFGGWLCDPENSQQVTDELAGVVAWATSLGDDKDIAEVIEESFRRTAQNFDIAKPLGIFLTKAVENDAHTPIVDMLAKAIENWLETDPARAKGWIDKQLPKWLPGLGKDKAGEWLYERLIELSKEVQVDFQHPIRRSIERLLNRFAEQLQTDPIIIERVNAAKMRLVDRPEVRHTISDIWITTKKTLRDEAADPKSELRIRVTTLLTNFGLKITADTGLQQTIDVAIENAAAHLIDTYRDEIAGIISDTVARWDAGDTAKKIELQVGRDLQFIRVNGTVVGALAGIAIHAIGELIIR
ncbi:unannotated protein [freshwater metagenome]|uniref:Unannotated protein n=1 Tax=freshwater metagenome TaxID=449393 RepID=A0A6J7SQX6_9ZZZZ|nr:DUF445 family protein [Actinomycetota bacterium]MSW24852.1 DUF445 family protein [Actinomycetota bacterium]MSX29504.1 DUF445 family protein [Actinomycetota bacterium]MSX43397.1 DUF445 family protein [Actinomycetota bacterium]MSX97254.1 DUF445 family protein [Actinomycetota bacterium]